MWFYDFLFVALFPVDPQVTEVLPYMLLCLFRRIIFFKIQLSWC